MHRKRRQFPASFEKRPGFAMNDLEIGGFRETFLFYVGELQNFALGQRRTEARHGIDNADMPRHSRLA